MSSIIWRQGRLLLLITVTGQIKTVKLSLSKTLGTFPYYLTLLSNRSVSGLLTRFSFAQSHGTAKLFWRTSCNAIRFDMSYLQLNHRRSAVVGRGAIVAQKKTRASKLVLVCGFFRSIVQLAEKLFDDFAAVGDLHWSTTLAGEGRFK